MMIDWTGIIIPARIARKRSGDAGKCSFANAYPAVVLAKRMSATAETVTIVELSSCCATGSSSKSPCQLSSEKPTPVRNWSYDRSDVSSMYANGKSMTTTTTQRIAKIAIRLARRPVRAMAIA